MVKEGQTCRARYQFAESIPQGNTADGGAEKHKAHEIAWRHECSAVPIKPGMKSKESKSSVL